MFRKIMEYLRMLDIIANSACGVVFFCSLIILFMWIVRLFKNSIVLRKKEKYSTRAAFNQETCLEALNSKVEYRKSLFMFAIVVCELVSSLLTIVKVIGNLVVYALQWGHSNSTDSPELNGSSHSDAIIGLNNNICNISNRRGMADSMNRLESVCFGISLILTFSLVYTLMSYYVMVTKKSLNYNTSLESVDLAREQKVLLLVSSVMCLILLVLLVRVEVYIVFQTVESCFVIFQFYLTCKYSGKLVQVFKWKIKDTEIAFGTGNHQYRSYNKTLSSYKWFAFFYKLVVFFFCIHILLRTVSIFTVYLQPHNMYALYGICINPHHSCTYHNILVYIMEIISQVEQIPLAISLSILFFLNLSTVPFLLSKINLSCIRLKNYKCLNFTFKKDLRRPLLNSQKK